MEKRPSGRPKARNPRTVRLNLRLTEHEVDTLCRAKPQGESLLKFARRCLLSYVETHYVSPWGGLRDTEEAQIQRARRAARRANATPQPALEAQIGQALQASGEDLAADAAAPVG